jgi:hypothetical protein
MQKKTCVLHSTLIACLSLTLMSCTTTSQKAAAKKSVVTNKSSIAIQGLSLYSGQENPNIRVII